MIASGPSSGRGRQSSARPQRCVARQPASAFAPVQSAARSRRFASRVRNGPIRRITSRRQAERSHPGGVEGVGAARRRGAAAHRPADFAAAKRHSIASSRRYQHVACGSSARPHASDRPMRRTGQARRRAEDISMRGPTKAIKVRSDCVRHSLPSVLQNRIQL
jgi:hypothetical protein